MTKDEARGWIEGRVIDAVFEELSRPENDKAIKVLGLNPTAAAVKASLAVIEESRDEGRT